MIEKTKPEVLNVPVEVIPTPSKPKINIQLVLIIILSLSLVSIGIAYAYNMGKQNNQPVATIPSPTAVSPTNTPTNIPTVTGEKTRFGEFNWIEPKLIDKITIFQNKTDSFYNDPANQGTFYQVGKFSDGSKLILGQIPFDGPSSGTGNFMRFIQTSDNQILYLTSNTDPWLIDSMKEFFVPTLNPISIELKGLSSPDVITYQKHTFTKGYEAGKMLTNLDKPIKLFDTEFGPIYVVIKPKILTDIDISGKIYYLMLKDTTLVSYNYPLDSSITKGQFQPSITWQDGTKSDPTLTPNIVMSCGGGGVGTPFVKEGSSLIAIKVLVGKTSNNQSVYQVLDQNNAIVKAFYNNYKVGREGSSLLSLSEFASKRNNVLIQDNFGDWQVYANQEFAPMAECGKPVIYLYPTKDTQVKVIVGADITKSEPQYPENGWSVLAHPSGLVDYQNNVYPNLFWEGTGHGVYANHAGEGFVVAQSKLISTIISQLKQQGLNNQETKDFMEFWQPKLPQTSFVRLTWLDTADMNVLAPLSVNPRPNTVIRVFLEFEGLVKYVSLKPQKLSAPARLGFVLVEWGGLLR